MHRRQLPWSQWRPLKSGVLVGIGIHPMAIRLLSLTLALLIALTSVVRLDMLQGSANQDKPSAAKTAPIWPHHFSAARRTHECGLLRFTGEVVQWCVGTSLLTSTLGVNSPGLIVLVGASTPLPSLHALQIKLQL